MVILVSLLNTLLMVALAGRILFLKKVGLDLLDKKYVKN
jgi:hypothetical protein